MFVRASHALMPRCEKTLRGPDPWMKREEVSILPVSLENRCNWPRGRELVVGLISYF
jgi:hypothetical protein